MKHLKTKLMMSVVSLMLATIMMTSASFAWFTISTAPEVSNVTTKMTANNNLEIILDNGFADATAAGYEANTLNPTNGATTTTNAARNVFWGNLVDLESFFDATNGSLKDLILKPVIAAEASGAITFATPTFAKDGRIDGKKDLATSTTKGVRTYDIESGNAPYVLAIDLWLRTNVDGVVVNLGTAAQRGDADGEAGLGSWITNDKITVKIGDAVEGKVYTAKHGTIADGKYPLTLTTATGTPNATTGKYEYTYTDATIALTKDVAKKLTVYVYMDGNGLSNADFEAAAKDVMLNLQFVDANATQKVTAANALQVTETSQYGRTSVSVPAAYPGSSSSSTTTSTN